MYMKNVCLRRFREIQEELFNNLVLNKINKTDGQTGATLEKGGGEGYPTFCLPLFRSFLENATVRRSLLL